MVTGVDTSFLFSLYGNDSHTPKALAWLQNQGSVLGLTVLNEYELGNALRFAEYRKALATGEAAQYWTQFEADRGSGRLEIKVCNLADVVEQAKRLSSTHTLASGHRSFDVLHVAGALVIGADTFLTFDVNQKKLAEAEGLNVPI